jgi:hypothetical protein
MKIIRQNNELTISIPDNVMTMGEIQEIIDYIKFRSITSKSKATQKDINNLSDEIDESWWNINKTKFIK